MTDTGPLFVSSGDLIADRRYKWAIDHAARGDLAGAADILAQTVEIAPAFATAWFALGAIRDRLGDRTGAVAAFEKARDADPDDYHGARLQLARLGSGEATPAMSERYVRRLFDQYAGRYDTALTDASPIADRSCCTPRSDERCARWTGRCIFPRCSISAVAPGSRAPRFAQSPTSLPVLIFRRR